MPSKQLKRSLCSYNRQNQMNQNTWFIYASHSMIPNSYASSKVQNISAIASHFYRKRHVLWWKGLPHFFGSTPYNFTYCWDTPDRTQIVVPRMTFLLPRSCKKTYTRTLINRKVVIKRQINNISRKHQFNVKCKQNRKYSKENSIDL